MYQHPQIHEAAVLLREDEGIDKRLEVYLVAHTAAVEKNTEEALSSRELRQYLQQYLPAYMLPSAYVVLESLPRTSNGKLDHRALPPPGRGEAALDDRPPYEAARTPVKELLVQIWTQAQRPTHGQGARIEQISIHENFFEPGGHSLLATQLLACGHDSLGVVLSLRGLLEAPTISVMAQAIEQQRGQANKHVDVIGRAEAGKTAVARTLVY